MIDIAAHIIPPRLWRRIADSIGLPARGAAGNPAERFGGQVVQIQGAAEHRSERIRHTRSEERRSLLGGPRLRGMARRRWAA